MKNQMKSVPPLTEEERKILQDLSLHVAPESDRIHDKQSGKDDSMKTEILSAEYTKAAKLNQHIKAHAEMMQENLYEICKGLKEMRDGKLYIELGYANFEEYCENEVGIKRRQAYNYISVASHLTEDFVQSIAQIGSTKLGILAKLDETERQEVMQKINVESATVKDMRKQIKKLTQKNQELEAEKQASAQALDEVTAEKKQLEAENQKLAIEKEALEEQQVELETQIVNLEREKEAIESAPKDVAVQEVHLENHERENLIQAMHQHDREWREEFDKLQEKSLKEQNELKREHQLEVDDLKKQLDEKDRQLSEKTPEESPEMKQFRIRLATVGDSIEQLLNFIGQYPETIYLDKSEQLLNGAESAMTEIRKQVMNL